MATASKLNRLAAALFTYSSEHERAMAEISTPLPFKATSHKLHVDTSTFFLLAGTESCDHTEP